MHAEESQPTSGLTPRPSPPAGSDGLGLGRPAPVGASRRLPLWLLTVGAGLVAGLISWAGGEATLDRFKLADEIVYPPNYKQISGYQKMAVQAEISVAAQAVVERKKAAVSFGFLGL